MDTLINDDFFGLASLFNMAETGSSRILTSRLPGSYAKRRISAAVVPHGHVSSEVCEAIFRDAIAGWGIGGSDEAMRDELLWSIAEVLVHGTSSEISWPQVTFTFEGAELTMAAFVAACSLRIGFANPVRVWVRDFRKGEVAVRISEMLNNPENIDIRQTQASRYGTTVDNAKFCYDTSHALFASGMTLGHADIILINQLAATAINSSQEDAISRGHAQAASNHAGTVGGAKPTPQVVPPPITSSSDRGGFKTVR